MSGFSHLKGLLQVMYYDSRGHDSSGNDILPGYECIELLIGGHAVYDLEGREFEVSAGDILWHIGGDRTVYRSDPADPYICIALKFEVFGASRRHQAHLSHWRELTDVRNFASEAVRAFHDNRTDRDILCTYLYSTLTWQVWRATHLYPSTELPRTLRRVLHYMEAHFSDEIQLTDLARVGGLSVPHLHAQFRHYLDTTPRQHLIQRRLQHARHRLATSEEAIKNLATECAYQNPESFVRAFCRQSGMSPGEYRRRHQPPEL